METPTPLARIRADAQSLTFTIRSNHQVPRQLFGQGVGAAAWETLAVERIAGKDFTLPRFDSAGRDRLFWRFRTSETEASQWVTELAETATRTSPLPWPKSIKGVQCVVDRADAVALGAKHVGMNLSIREVLLPAVGGPYGGPVEFMEVDGEKIPLAAGALARYDDEVRAFTQAGILVTVIFLNYFPRDAADGDLLIHPHCDKKGAANPLSAFNLSNPKSERLYRGLLQFLAKRWTEPEGRFGRVGGFIIGNEVQSHWHWYNLGKATPETLVREYADALRLAWLAVKSAHRDLRVYVSMDYYWTDRHEAPDRTMPGRQLIDGLNALAKAEGDFDWHVAHHPYPQGLFDPVFWDDEDAGLGFDTPIVTFKNLEVLLAYLNQPGQRVKNAARRVILSEQGFNCKGSGEQAEKVQAAAYAYAFEKVRHMPGVDAFILHRHQDHPAEGGLKLGLRDLEGRRRPMWSVCQKAETSEWAATIAPLLPLTGLKSWDDAKPTTKRIGERSGVGVESLYPGEVVWDGVKQLWTATPTNCLDWRQAKEKTSTGKRVPGLFQHPKAVGVAEASFPVTLPKATRLTLRFEVLNSAKEPAPRGITFGVRIDGKEIWSTTLTDCGKPTPHALDLTPYAGRAIALTFTTNANGKEAYCWATWLAPAILAGQ
ncbi:DUF5722 domain-containing protein [Armatimonas rosea]|uniref:DUF5722 domain-containing protein n=1 Tax=Armatimonas rosea TaxID=685828 RepID=A0A7W9SP30_ARMRO|nr:DUF5722 domain-containing protein [Armatimonas rosea]MBB6050165.1 hypothetical protein [Armatimonas rosea]